MGFRISRFLIYFSLLENALCSALWVCGPELHSGPYTWRGSCEIPTGHATSLSCRGCDYRDVTGRGVGDTGVNTPSAPPAHVTSAAHHTGWWSLLAYWWWMMMTCYWLIDFLYHIFVIILHAQVSCESLPVVLTVPHPSCVNRVSWGTDLCHLRLCKHDENAD